MASTLTTQLELPKVLVAGMFDKTKGHSTLAKLSGQTPIAFSGSEVMTFNLDGEVSIVGEGAAKPAGSAAFAPVTIVPIKFVYQHRVSDEFIKSGDEARLPYLQAFADGFAKKIARGLDIAAFHGVDPATGTEADSVSAKSFDRLVTSTITYSAAAVDDNIDDAVAVIQGEDGEINGIALAPAAGSALGKLKASGAGLYLYPEFRFGANPGSFGGMTADINSTVAFGSSADRAIVGDFQNAFKWGYAEAVPMEIIEYGDPDGLGDLKRYNQVVLRAEAYVGWGILDASSFVRIVSAP